MKLLFPNSNWGSNIGNAFFTYSYKKVIEQCAEGITVLDGGSNPVLPLKISSRRSKYALDYPSYIGEVNGMVFAGPMFDSRFRELYEPTLKRASELGIPVLLVSAGGMSYSKEEISTCRSVLQQYKPFLLASRDKETYETYGDLAQNAIDGICGAWFIGGFYEGYSTPHLGDYIASCFDFRPEPSSRVFEEAVEGSQVISLPSIRNSKVSARIKRIVVGSSISEVQGKKIIRTSHRPANPSFSIFNAPNTYAAYTPFPYLNIYKNAEFTITDRLHAAVASLSFGRPAYLTLRSPRSKLLDSVGIEYEAGRRLHLNLPVFEARKERLISDLTDVLRKL